jgi:hypothetical protein
MKIEIRKFHGRTVSSPDIRWYFANNPSPAVPNAFGEEDAIRAVVSQSGQRPAGTLTP